MAIPADNIKKYEAVPSVDHLLLLTTHMDSRMMAHPYPLPYPTSRPQSSWRSPPFASLAKQIYLQDGIKGFYRGLGPCFLRAFPVNASALFVYEGTMRLLGAENVCT